MPKKSNAWAYVMKQAVGVDAFNGEDTMNSNISQREEEIDKLLSPPAFNHQECFSLGFYLRYSKCTGTGHSRRASSNLRSKAYAIAFYFECHLPLQAPNGALIS